MSNKLDAETLALARKYNERCRISIKDAGNTNHSTLRTVFNLAVNIGLSISPGTKLAERLGVSVKDNGSYQQNLIDALKDAGAPEDSYDGLILFAECEKRCQDKLEERNDKRHWMKSLPDRIRVFKEANKGFIPA